jgi:DNA-binding beta-propeller fold protein YncE
MMKRHAYIGAAFVVLLALLGVAQSALQKSVVAQTNGAPQAPRFEVDPMWPKPLPNGWYQGQTIGVSVDARDHIWIIHRSDSLDQIEAAADEKTGDCCKKAPPILEFDQEGNLLRHWGGSDGPGYQWPASNHGIWIDHKGFVWIGGNGAGNDGHILKFTQDGKFVMQVGIKQAALAADSNSDSRFYLVAKLMMDTARNELYAADGYGNRRVVVVDPDTGKFKRFWGAYGNKPDDQYAAAQPRYTPGSTPSQQFRGPVHCADVSTDGLVYVCDRTSDRLQVFTREGKFVKEVFVAPDSLGDGSTWDVAFSRDPQQKYLYLADGRNQKLRIFDRQSMTELTNFGEGGHYPGQFYSMHSIATDSKGNLYTTETYQGRRVQKFVYKGLGPVIKKEQGTVWPTRTSQ